MHEVRAEITATIWQIRAEVGETLSDGHEIMILESMKMEIPVLVEVAGVLQELHVREGDTVHEGDLLATVEPA